MSTIDVSSLTAFDVHTHVHRSVRAGQQPEPGGREDMGEYFRIGTMPRYTVPELADYYRQRHMACVTFTVDSISQTGDEPVPDNFEVAELAAEHADVLIPFASIDPARGAAGVAQARRLIADFGVRGFKFHPGTQAFYPNDRMAYRCTRSSPSTAWWRCSTPGRRGSARVPRRRRDPAEVLQPAVPRRRGRRLPGHGHHHGPSVVSLAGRGAVDRHPQAAGLHRPVRLVPEVLLPELVRYAGTLLRHKVLFGTDFPVITPERWIKDFENVSIKPEVRPLIMKENAARLFGLSGAASGG